MGVDRHGKGDLLKINKTKRGIYGEDLARKRVFGEIQNEKGGFFGSNTHPYNWG